MVASPQNLSMFELNLLCPENRVDVLSEALEALDALSVSVEDADAETEHEQALFGEPGMPPPKEGWQRSKVLALFAKEEEAREAALLLAAQDFLDCAHLARATPSSARNHPLRSWPGLWHGYPPHHAHVFAMDCHAQFEGAACFRLWLRIRHLGHWRCKVWSAVH